MPNNFFPPIFRFVFALSLIFSGLGVSSSSAEEPNVLLKLKNGDRITGRLISESTNHVVISTSWAKELTMPLTDIDSREVISPKPAIATTSEPKTNAVAEVKPAVVTQVKPKVAKKKSWSGKVDIGADLGFNEKSWQLYYGRAKIIYAPQSPPEQLKKFSERFKNTFDYQATYGRTDGVLSANRMDGTSKTDFDIGKKLFVYNLVGGGYDEVRRISLQYEVGPGVGYHLIARSNLVVNTELGMNYQVQHLERTGGGSDIIQKRFSLRLAQDATWSLSQKLTFDEKLEFYPNLEDIGQFRIRFEANLRYAIWQNGGGQNIFLALSMLNLYETEPASGVGKNDLQIRSSIGVNF